MERQVNSGGDCKQTILKGNVNSCTLSVMNGIFFLENIHFHFMSPVGSDFCSLLFFGNFYDLNIFSIGNSTKTKEKNLWG